MQDASHKDRLCCFVNVSSRQQQRQLSWLNTNVLLPAGRVRWSIGSQCFRCDEEFLPQDHSSDVDTVRRLRGSLKASLRWCALASPLHEVEPCIVPDTAFFRNIAPLVRHVLSKAPLSDLHVIGNSLARNLATTLLDVLSLASHDSSDQQCASAAYVDAPDFRWPHSGDWAWYPSYCPQVADAADTAPNLWAYFSRRWLRTRKVSSHQQIHGWKSWSRVVRVALDARGTRAAVTVHFHWSPGVHCGSPRPMLDVARACTIARSARGPTTAPLAPYKVDQIYARTANALGRRTFNATTNSWQGFDFRYLNATVASRCPTVATILAGPYAKPRSSGVRAVVVPVGAKAACSLRAAAAMAAQPRTHHVPNSSSVATRLLFVNIDPLQTLQAKEIGTFAAAIAANASARRREPRAGERKNAAFLLPFGAELDHTDMLLPRGQPATAQTRSIRGLLSRVRDASIYYDNGVHPGAPYSRIAALQVLLSATSHQPQAVLRKLEGLLAKTAHA